MCRRIPNTVPDIQTIILRHFEATNQPKHRAGADPKDTVSQWLAHEQKPENEESGEPAGETLMEKVAKMLNDSGKLRVSDLAEKLGISKEDLGAAIKAPGTGFKVARAGWVQIETQ